MGKHTHPLEPTSPLESIAARAAESAARLFVTPRNTIPWPPPPHSIDRGPTRSQKLPSRSAPARSQCPAHTTGERYRLWIDVTTHTHVSAAKSCTSVSTIEG
mmetsp:Transcript_9062/g.10471  ORF Transcript_9062/g.10471 Transcript_9062/m.10471 type:complete len:102 (+) Transcript_9062:122-427(+)